MGGGGPGAVQEAAEGGRLLAGATHVRARRTCFCTTSERCRVMGGVTGAVSCAAGCNVGAAGRVQLEGGLGRQLGDGACMALANRSCLLALLVMERGELIFTASGAPSGALAYGFFGATGVLGFWLLRGMCSPSECVSPKASLPKQRNNILARGYLVNGGSGVG